MEELVAPDHAERKILLGMLRTIGTTGWFPLKQEFRIEFVEHRATIVGLRPRTRIGPVSLRAGPPRMTARRPRIAA
jgi:hypothetical protein